MNTKLHIPLLLILVSFVWAGSFIVVNATTKNIDPIQLGFLRFLVATPLMGCLLIFRRNHMRIPKKELLSLAILGLTGVTLLYIFQFIGIHFTNASTASVLINTNVIFIAILSVLLIREKLSFRRTLGIILSFGGVLVVMLSNLRLEQFLLTNTFFLGCLLILLSALCWAIYSIVGKRLLEHYDAIVVTTYAFTLGTVFYLPFVIPNIIPVITHTSFDGWMAIVYLALVCSLFGYLGWYYALQKMDASKAAVFLNFIPLFTILMSFFLGQSLTGFFLVGAILIIYGVYVTQKT